MTLSQTRIDTNFRLMKKNEEKAESIDNWMKYGAEEILETPEELDTSESDLDLIIAAEQGNIIEPERG